MQEEEYDVTTKTKMGTFANVDCLCRLCGAESQDLIYLFGNSNGDRDLVAIIKKYVNIIVSIMINYCQCHADYDRDSLV